MKSIGDGLKSKESIAKMGIIDMPKTTMYDSEWCLQGDWWMYGMFP